MLWRYLFLCPVYLICASLPLLTSVGANLEYEYTLLASWFTLIGLPLFGLFLKTRYLPITEGKYDPPVAFDILWMTIPGPIIAALPALFLYLAGHCQCSPNGTIFWSVFQWLPAWVLGHALMYVIMRLRISRPEISRKRISLGLVGLLAAIALLILGELWFSPQKRLISMFAGFLHGPIYDDWIPFDMGLFLGRSAHLLLALVLLFLSWFRGQFSVAVTTMVFAGLYLLIAVLGSNYPSIHNGQDHLDTLLPGTIKGESYTLHYRPSEKQLDLKEKDQNHEYIHPTKVLRMNRDIQFHINDLKEQLKDTPIPHVHVYAYPSDDAKKLWFGGGSTDVADVYTPSIHITFESWPHPTLRHELVHALLSEIGYHGLGFHPNMAFTEGIAESLAPRDRLISLDQGAAALIQSNRIPDVEGLFSPMFWQHAGNRAYTVAGSIINFIARESGMEKVALLYSGASWQEAVGANREDIVTRWQDVVTSKSDPEKYKLYTESLYRFPGILNDRCPHSKVDLRKSRRKNLFVRLRQPIGWDPDKDYHPWMLRLHPNHKSYRVKLWRKEINRAATDRFTSSGRMETWLEALAKARSTPVETLEDIELMLMESDVARLTGDRDRSIDLLAALKQEIDTVFPGYQMVRHIEARIRIEQLELESHRIEWRKYLAGWRKHIPEIDVETSPWLLVYLKVRNDHRNRIKPWDLAKFLELETDSEMSQSFQKEWYEILARKLFLAESYDLAGKAYQKASTLSEGDSRRHFEILERHAAWFHKSGPLVEVDESEAPKEQQQTKKPKKKKKEKS